MFFVIIEWTVRTQFYIEKQCGAYLLLPTYVRKLHFCFSVSRKMCKKSMPSSKNKKKMLSLLGLGTECLTMILNISS